MLLVGVFYRPLWWFFARKFYRNPEAIAPSGAGFALRITMLVIVGVIITVFSAYQLVSFAEDEEEKEASQTSAEQCRELESQVGNPISLDEADETIRDAASEKGYEVNSREKSEDEELELPSGDSSVTTETTMWTVLDDGEEIIQFTWIEPPDGGQGLFSAKSCRSS